jgi:hypothetical protein
LIGAPVCRAALADQALSLATSRGGHWSVEEMLPGRGWA